jgi:pimeloyl-ACP methyl ester carboxylesterase
MNTCFFLRGLVRESGHWSGFLEAFQQDFPDWKLVALDLPGCGNRNLETSPLSIDAIVERLRREYLEKRTEKNYFFAISLGAMVGFHWLQKYSEDFSGAVFCNTSMKGLSPLHHRLQPSQWGKILGLFFTKDTKKIERSILEITCERKTRFAELEQAWTKIQEARPVSKRNALRQLLAAARYSPSAQGPTAKVLLLNGAKDRLVSPNCSVAIAQKWNVPLLVHPEAGHDLTLDEPSWVLTQTKDFFLTFNFETESRTRDFCWPKKNDR